MSAAQVTEAHRQAAVSIFELAMKSSHHGAPFREPCAQFIADSEAKACAELLQQVANLKYSNHYHRKTAETSRATETDRNNLRADLDAIKAILNEEKARAERAEAELKRYNDAVDAQPWASDLPIRVLLDRITIRLAAAETQLSTNYERAENIIKSREERIENLGQEVTERRRNAQKDAAMVGRLRRALADAISTYDPTRKETLVTAERQEAWIAALQEGTK